jgi:hypothetical protein
MAPAWRITATVACSLCAIALAGAASAQVDLSPADTMHGVLDVRASAADGEPSFTTRGFGKFRLGGDPNDGGLDPKLQVSLAALEWTPRLGWALSAVVDAGHQPGQENWIDLYQAYLLIKPVPQSATRFKARIGYFYPPVSLENDGRVWTDRDAITPSVIASWIGEEVKVLGGEASVSHDFGDQQVTLTGALYGYDETSGALLTFRGWGLDDLQSQAFGAFDLPPLSPFLTDLQDDQTYSARELDGRVGYYVAGEWATPWPLTLSALHYDNNGDGTTLDSELQWSWATQFTTVGAAGRIGDHTRLLAQALDGETRIGFKAHPLTDVGFRAAFVQVSHDLGDDTLTARADAFEASDLAPRTGSPTLGEHGWAITGDWRHPLGKHLDLRLEASHVESTRPSRVLAGERPFQAQTLLQSSLRVSY